MRRERDKKQQERLADAADVTAELETRVDAGTVDPAAERAEAHARSNAETVGLASESVGADTEASSRGSAGRAGLAAGSVGADAEAGAHASAGAAGLAAQSAGTGASAHADATSGSSAGSAGTTSPGAEQAVGARRAAGALESAVLGVLWSASEPLSPGEVREKLARSEAADGGPALWYSTVVTILTRLHEKRALSRQRDGRAYRYAPLADEAGLAARRLSQLLDRAPDREAVLSRFVADLSERDEQVLRDLLGGRGDGAGSSGTA